MVPQCAAGHTPRDLCKGGHALPSSNHTFHLFFFLCMNNPNHPFLWLTSLNVSLYSLEVCPGVSNCSCSHHLLPLLLPGRKPKEGRGEPQLCSVLLSGNNVSLGSEAKSVRRRPIRSRRSKRWWEDHSGLVGAATGRMRSGGCL